MVEVRVRVRLSTGRAMGLDIMLPATHRTASSAASRPTAPRTYCSVQTGYSSPRAAIEGTRRVDMRDAPATYKNGHVSLPQLPDEGFPMAVHSLASATSRCCHCKSRGALHFRSSCPAFHTGCYRRRWQSKLYDLPAASWYRRIHTAGFAHAASLWQEARIAA